MRLTRLKIIRHRWCAPTELILGAKRQLVLGKNGTGKTRLLELIARVCRAVPDELSEEPLEVEADFEGADGSAELRIRSEGYDLTGVDSRFAGEPERKYTISGSFTAKNGSQWSSVPTFEINQETRALVNGGRRIHLNPKGSVWAALVHLYVDFQSDDWSSHPVAVLAEWGGLRRFDEALGVYLRMSEAKIWLFQYDRDKAAYYYQSNDGERWIESGTSADGAEQRRAKTIQVMAVPAVFKAAALLGYAADVEVEFSYREPISGQGASGARFDRPEMYFFKADVRVRDSALSFGEKRTISFMVYLNANPQIIIADELMNGLHHSLGVALLNEIGDRQAFLATHEPVLMDEVDFESADELRRSLLLCRRNPDPKGPPFVWSQIDETKAARIFHQYDVASIKHGHELLQDWGIW
jgi:ABC-type lipoprotein export system ATPase subunit